MNHFQNKVLRTKYWQNILFSELLWWVFLESSEFWYCLLNRTNKSVSKTPLIFKLIHWGSHQFIWKTESEKPILVSVFFPHAFSNTAFKAWRSQSHPKYHSGVPEDLLLNIISTFPHSTDSVLNKWETKMNEQTHKKLTLCCNPKKFKLNEDEVLGLASQAVLKGTGVPADNSYNLGQLESYAIPGTEIEWCSDLAMWGINQTTVDFGGKPLGTEWSVCMSRALDCIL